MRTLPETLTPAETKICDFPYPISDLKPRSPARDWTPDKLLRHVHGGGGGTPSYRLYKYVQRSAKGHGFSFFGIFGLI